MFTIVVIFLSFSEDSFITSHPEKVNIWYVIFEIASAYGNVGCSVCVYGESYSLAGGFSLAGKIAIMFTMLLGKHRGLPENSDSVLDFEFKELRHASGLNASQNIYLIIINKHLVTSLFLLLHRLILKM